MKDSSDPSQPADREALYQALLRESDGDLEPDEVALLRSADPLDLERGRALLVDLQRCMDSRSGHGVEQGLTRAQRQTALAAFDKRPGARKSSPWRRLVARLSDVLETGDDELSPALRASVGARRSFQALYEVEGYDLDLTLAEDGALYGQVVGRDDDEPTPFEGGMALLQDGSGNVRSVPVEEDGEFCFPDAPSGTVGLALDGRGIQLLVEGVDLPPA